MVPRSLYTPPCRDYLFIRGCQYLSEIFPIIQRPQSPTMNMWPCPVNKIFFGSPAASMLKQSPWRGSQSLKGGVETVSMATCSAQIERAPGYTTTPCLGAFTCFPRSYTPALLLLLEPQQDHRCFPELSVLLKQNRKWLLQIPMGKCHTGLPTRHRTFHLNAECPPGRG